MNEVNGLISITPAVCFSAHRRTLPASRVTKTPILPPVKCLTSCYKRTPAQEPAPTPRAVAPESREALWAPGRDSVLTEHPPAIPVLFKINHTVHDT